MRPADFALAAGLVASRLDWGQVHGAARLSEQSLPALRYWCKLFSLGAANFAGFFFFHILLIRVCV